MSWLSQMESVYELLGFGSRVMRVIPYSSRENCAWEPVRRSESGLLVLDTKEVPECLSCNILTFGCYSQI